MRRAMLQKEFQELIVWAGLLLIIMLLATVDLAGTNPLTLQKRQYDIPIPFVNSQGLHGLGLYGSIAAIVLAMRQTIGESVQGTWIFLLHRTVSRKWIVLHKMIAGLSVFYLITGIPFAGYTLWAATPGTHASPFRWEFVLPTLTLWISLSIVYLGAFLCGLREANWVGSRLLPLAGTIGFFLVLYAGVSTYDVRIEIGAILVTLLLDALLLKAVIAAAETREFST